MRFLVDECTGPLAADWLRGQQHEVFSVYEQARGADDDTLLHKAFAENWILITNDKDFGEKVFGLAESAHQQPHAHLSADAAVVCVGYNRIKSEER